VPWNQDFYLAWEDFVCLAWSQFYSAEPGRSRLSGDDAARAYLGSAPLNDFFLSRDGTAVNRGVALGTVMQACGAVLQTIPIRDVPLTTGRLLEPDRLALENGELRILRPSANAPAPTATPGTTTPTPAFTWAPSQPLPKFATPWPGPLAAAVDSSRTAPLELITEADLIQPEYQLAPEQPKSAYPMPARYPVKLTDPILVPRPYSGVNANIYVIRMFPR
jgi:hypothetical protein